MSALWSAQIKPGKRCQKLGLGVQGVRALNKSLQDRAEWNFGKPLHSRVLKDDVRIWTHEITSPCLDRIQRWLSWLHSTLFCIKGLQNRYIAASSGKGHNSLKVCPKLGIYNCAVIRYKENLQILSVPTPSPIFGTHQPHIINCKGLRYFVQCVLAFCALKKFWKEQAEAKRNDPTSPMVRYSKFRDT